MLRHLFVLLLAVATIPLAALAPPSPLLSAATPALSSLPSLIPRLAALTLRSGGAALTNTVQALSFAAALPMASGEASRILASLPPGALSAAYATLAAERPSHHATQPHPHPPPNVR